MAETEVLIIGCGIAGATAALRLARNPQRQITIITRARDSRESNTRYAQGGIIGRGPDDTSELLFEDIIAAGAGVTLPAAAQILADEGPLLLNEILERTAGVVFDHDSAGKPRWGQEAAHSRRRILHVGDATGRAIEDGLIAALNECSNIKIETDVTAVDLITFPHHSRDPLDNYRPISCHGCYVFDRKENAVHRYLATTTILATGGLGRIYRSTTNPVGARGDGLAMAHRAGARIANAEYVQFHPTALAAPGAEGLLISEAVRGEGGVLLTPDLRAFMPDYSPQWKDLAPRDVVARAIHHEMETNGYSYVLLDIASHMPAAAIRERFPFIYQECLKVGLDISTEPVPVVPAAHYFCGGVLVDEWGRSTIRNLYAIGEISCTGVHGANRLASTSLLEGLVWGNRSAVDTEKALQSAQERPAFADIPPWDESGLSADPDPALIQGDMQTIQNIMWHYVGLVRSA
ncbi:MAG TPA: FAD-dependent oxidoreductase, partial [Pyrinomonadaceae bacterium]|nr:FAD-dependent oxidoreductase [Pyrinomonadaceae bacterium]